MEFFYGSLNLDSIMPRWTYMDFGKVVDFLRFFFKHRFGTKMVIVGVFLAL